MTLSILRKVLAFMLVFSVSMMMVACSTTEEEDEGEYNEAQEEMIDEAL